MSLPIIPGLLFEDDFKFFTEDTYSSLRRVTNDVVGSFIYEYLKHEDKSTEVASNITKYIGDWISSFTLHLDLQDRGILDIIKSIQPAAILQSDPEYRERVFTALSYLESISTKIRTVVPPRSKVDFEAFVSSLSVVENEMSKMGTTWEVVRVEGVNFNKRLTANKSIFYTPHETERRLASAIVDSRRNDWQQALNAIKYDKYCNEHGIPIEQRTLF